MRLATPSLSLSIALAPLLMLGSALGGCASAPDPANAIRVDAFDASGRTTTDPDVLRNHGTEPVIFAFDAGDEVEIIARIEAAGYVEAIDDHRVRVIKPFELYVSGRGIYVREPGGDFERLHGAFGASFSMSEAKQRNEVVVSVAVDAGE